MSQFQVVYIPVGVPTFHLESAKLQFDASVQMLRSLTDDGVYPNDMLLSIDELKEFLDGINPDLIILQNITLTPVLSQKFISIHRLLCRAYAQAPKAQPTHRRR